jgi:hypothetical protein
VVTEPLPRKCPGISAHLAVVAHATIIWACFVSGMKANSSAYRVLVKRSAGRILLKKTKCGSEVSIRTDLTEIG